MEQYKNTRIDFMYRDGGNNKEIVGLVFNGLITREQHEQLTSAYYRGETGLVLNEIGIVSPNEIVLAGRLATAADHVLTELPQIADELDIEDWHTEEPVTAPMSVSEFIRRASIAPKNIEAEMERLGIENELNCHGLSV